MYHIEFFERMKTKRIKNQKRNELITPDKDVIRTFLTLSGEMENSDILRGKIKKGGITKLQILGILSR